MEIDKIKLMSYYFRVTSSIIEFSLEDIKNWFVTTLKHGEPNLYRIKKNLLKSTDFLKGNKDNHFKLNPKCFTSLETKFKLTENSSEEIETINTILPETLYKNTRGFIESLSKQINASFENNVFDGLLPDNYSKHTGAIDIFN